MERDLRKMINGSNEYEIEAILTKIVEQIRIQYPTADMILQIAEQEPRIADRPELAQIFKERQEELKRLVCYSLQPEKLGCKNNSYPYLAHNILKSQPSVILSEFLDPPNPSGQCLFQFLGNNPNETARGYFYDMLNSFSNNFQDKMRNFLLADSRSLDLCLAKSHYPEVFNFLFNIIIYSTEHKGDFEAKLLRGLLDKVADNTEPVIAAENILCMLQEMNENASRLNHFVSDLVLNRFNEEFVDNVVLMIVQKYQTDEEHCENLLQILTEVTRLYEFFHNSNQKTPGKYEIKTMQDAVAKIIQSIGKIGDILKCQFKSQICISNGENVVAVGLMRYYTLELISKLMELPPEFVSKNFDINKGGLLHMLQVYITKNPWNNMAHRLVEKIVISIIDSFQNYAQIEQNYIGPKGFLGFLIETFKTHDYMFLNSGKLSTYGYIHFLYNIAKAICVKLQKSADLRTVMQKFQPWGEFILQDLQKYEMTMEGDLGGQPLNQVNTKKKNKQESIRKIVVDLSQQKQISITAEPNQDQNEHFVEIILYSQGFMKGRSAVRKTSYTVDSPYRHRRFNNDDVKSQGNPVQFFSHQNSPARQEDLESMNSQGSPIALTPMVDRNDLFSFKVFSTMTMGTFGQESDPVQMGGSQLLQTKRTSTQQDRNRSNSQEVTLKDFKVT